MTSTGNSAGKICHDVEFRAAVQRVQKAAHGAGDERLEPLHGAWAERLVDQTTKLGVGGLVHHDHHVQTEVAPLEQHFDGHAEGAREALGVLVGGDDVSVPGQREEAVLLAAVDRRHVP